MRFHIKVTVAVGLFLSTLTAIPALAQGYRIERIASGLNQPTYVTQAPNDPANIIYFTERTRSANPGFGAANTMGRVWRYDTKTRTRTQVLDLSQYFVTNDTGLQTIAFHPEFNTPETPGYGKLYVSHAEARGSSNGTARNRVEEYTVNLSGPSPTYAASFSRLLLQYDNNTENNHTINWIGFDPTATGEVRNYLYVSTGDGSFGNTYARGTSPNGRPSQNPSDIAGKMLRVDVVGPDAYPQDSLKNFAIPHIQSDSNLQRGQPSHADFGPGRSVSHRAAERVPGQLRPSQRRLVDGRRRRNLCRRGKLSQSRQQCVGAAGRLRLAAVGGHGREQRQRRADMARPIRSRVSLRSVPSRNSPTRPGATR